MAESNHTQVGTIGAVQARINQAGAVLDALLALGEAGDGFHLSHDQTLGMVSAARALLAQAEDHAAGLKP